MPVKITCNITPHRLRLMRYLKLNGRVDRERMVLDLINRNTKIGRGYGQGSNSAIPAIAGKWVNPLMIDNLVREHWSSVGGYRHEGFELTKQGLKYLEELDNIEKGKANERQ